MAQDRKAVLTKQLGPDAATGEETNKETLRLPPSPGPEHESAERLTQRQLEVAERDGAGQENAKLVLKSSKLDQIVTSGGSLQNTRKGREEPRPDLPELQLADANKESQDQVSQIRQKVDLKSVITAPDSPQQPSFPSPQSADQLKITQPRQLTAECV